MKEMTENEKTIRNCWLGFSIFYWLSWDFANLFTLLLSFHGVFEITETACFKTICYLVKDIVLFLIGWHCSYKNQGTIWLTILLITIPIVTCLFLITLAVGGFYMPVVLYIVLSFIFFLLSLRLRKINKRVVPNPLADREII